MHDIIYKSTIGTGGFIASIELGNLHALSGTLAGLATFVYMTIAAIKLIKELRNEKEKD